MKGRISIDGRKNSQTDLGHPIVVYLTSPQLKKKEHPIQTGFHTKKTQWNKKTKRVKSSHKNEVNINNALDALEVKLRDLIRESRTRSFTYQKAEEFILNKGTGVFYNDAMVIAIKMHPTYKASLEAFNRLYPNASYTLIDNSLVTNFSKELLKTPTKKGKRSPNGVNAYLTHLTFLWKVTSDLKNPFRGVRVKPAPTKEKHLPGDEIFKLTDHNLKSHNKATYGGVENYINYCLLCFYLGGIDIVDLIYLERSNIVNGRIEFYRRKGNSSVFVSNFIFPEAQELFDLYDHKKYLIPVTPKNRVNLLTSIHKRMDFIKDGLQLSRKLYSKTPRYTFINRGMNLLVDERITSEIVGHTENTTHSIYKGRFPNAVKDEAHKRIITL